MKKIVLLIAAVAALAVAAVPIAGAGQTTTDKVRFCHATGSSTNPYVVIETSTSGAYHGHLGAGHQKGEDIIPPFEYKGKTYSQNWDATGQAIFNAGCEKPKSTPPTTPKPPTTPAVCPTGTTPIVGSNPLTCLKETTTVVEKPVVVEKIVEVPTTKVVEKVLVKYKTKVVTKTVVKWKTKKVIVKQCPPTAEKPKTCKPGFRMWKGKCYPIVAGSG